MPTDIPSRLNGLRAQHHRSFATPSDEVYERNPVCAADGHAWPCEVAEVFALVGAEVAHRVNPVIGWLRLAERDSKPPTTASHERLRDTVTYFRGENQ